MSERIERLDALRGWTLLLIAIIHFMEQYLGAMAPAEHFSYAQHGVLDRLIEAIGFIVIRGKEYSIFSFLFGLGFAMQMQQAESRAQTSGVGGDFRPRFMIRLLVLALIGLAHGLIYGGDILLIFAVLGLPLLLFYRVGNRWLVALALVLISGAPRILYMLVAPHASSTELSQAAELAQREAVTHWNALTSGSFWQMAWPNLTLGLKGKAFFQFGVFARGYQTFGFFLLGLWAGRRRFFEDLDTHRPFFKRVFKWTAVPTLLILLVSVAGAVWTTFHAQPQSAQGGGGLPTSMWNWPTVIGLSVYDAWNFAATAFYASSFILISGWGRMRWLNVMAPVGRMTLTNYLGQSLVGTFIFMGFGLGMLGKIGSSWTAPMGLAVFLIGAIASALWLKAFRLGPMEWLWRSVVAGRIQAFRK